MLAGMVKRDRHGDEIDLLSWSDLFDNMTYRVVAEDRVGDLVVRTVWEGIDEVPGAMFATGVAPGATLRFETIVESDDEAQARDRHRRVVELVGTGSWYHGFVHQLRTAVTQPT